MARSSIGTTVWPAALAAVAALLLSAPAAADPTPTGPPPGPVTAADQVPHLSSPDNPPPGTTTLPERQEGHRMAYLRELWHAYQTQEVSGSDALLLLTQSSMDPNAAPPPGKAAGPQPVLAPEAQPAPVPAPEAPAPSASAPESPGD